MLKFSPKKSITSGSCKNLTLKCTENALVLQTSAEHFFTTIQVSARASVECVARRRTFQFCNNPRAANTQRGYILEKGDTILKTGRNDPCPCGSGKKYKKCCMEKDEEAERLALLELQKAKAAEETAAAEADDAGEGNEGEGKTEAHPGSAEPPPLRTRLRQPVKNDKGAPSRAMRMRSKDFAKRWTTQKRAEG